MVAKMFVRQRKRNGASPKAAPFRFDQPSRPPGPRDSTRGQPRDPGCRARREVHVADTAAAVWAGLQLDFDMARAMEHADRIKVRRVS